MNVKDGYELLFSSDQAYLFEDVPVMVERIDVIRKMKTEESFVRCAFRSIADESISRIDTDIILTKDDKEVGVLEDISYVSLITARNTVFGMKEGHLADTEIDFDGVIVRIKSVLFADGTEVVCSGAIIPAPEKVLQTDVLGDEELAEEYRRETCSKGEYMPAESGDYWMCSCGLLNRKEEEICYSCDCSKEILFAEYDPEVLRENREAYIAEQEELERIRLEEEQRQRELKAKRKKMIIIITTAVIVIAAFLFSYFKWIQPAMKYNSGKEALEAGDYQKAYEAFSKLDDYKDSEELSVEAAYQYGILCVDEENYDKAIEVLTSLDGYEDSNKYINKAKLGKANQLIDEKKYEEAIDLLGEIKNLKGTDKALLAAKYGYVTEHKDKKDKKTIKYLKTLKKADYKDSNKIYDELFKWEVSIFFNTSQTDTKTKVKAISKYDSAYCHVILSGGAPGDSTKLRYVMTSPGGGTTSETWSKTWKKGTSGGTVYWSDVAQYAPSGKLSVTVYDANTGKRLGSASVSITG